MSPIIFAVYALGFLTIASFLTFVVLLYRYLQKTPRAAAQQASDKEKTDELQSLDPQKLFETIGKIVSATADLTKALNEAKPVVWSAVLTILFLLGWLFSLTLLVIPTTAH